jgi:hypothetical protein
MKYSLSASMVAATRRASYLFPRVTVVRGYEYEKWRGTCEAIRTACRRSYQLFGHCENPFPAGDLRRWEWIEETLAIVRERLQLVMRDTAWAEPDAVVRLGAAKPGEVVPFPDPQPKPEEQEQQKEAATCKRLIRWNGEDVYV